MQVPSAVGLGPEHPRQLRRGERGGHRVVGDTGRVHDRGQVRLGREHRGQGRPVGDVAGHDPHAEFVPQVPRPGRVLASAAEQQHVRRSPGDEVPGHQRAEPRGAAGDQHGAPARPPGVLRRVRGGQPGAAEHAVARREFGFSGDHRVTVHEEEAPRVFGLRRPDQTPDGGVRRVGDRAVEVAVGAHEQPPVRGERVLDGGERGRHDLAGVRPVRGGPDLDVGRGQRPHVDLVPHHPPRPVTAGGSGELVLADRTPGQGLHRRHGLTVRVGQVQPHGLAVRGDPQPHRAGPGAVQPHPGPGEGQQRAVVAVGEQAGVQAGVEQGRVQAEPGDVEPFGHRDLGEHLVPSCPHRAQSPKRRAVVVAAEGEPVVGAGQVAPLGALGRPRAQRDGLTAAGTDVASAVPDPVAVGAGVHGHGSAAVLVRRPQLDAEFDLGVRPEDQRRFEDEFPQPRTADLLGGAAGQLDEPGPGQQHGAAHGVVGQPRLRPVREPPGEHDRAAGG